AETPGGEAGSRDSDCVGRQHTRSLLLSGPGHNPVGSGRSGGRGARNRTRAGADGKRSIHLPAGGENLAIAKRLPARNPASARFYPSSAFVNSGPLCAPNRISRRGRRTEGRSRVGGNQTNR